MSGLTKSLPGSGLARRFLEDQQGATAIEYALIAAGIGATVATTVYSLGSAMKQAWWDKIVGVL